jgi:Flp pilus assembly protein TadG
MARARRSRSGAAAIEFAFTFVVYIVLFFGIIDWGWLFYRRAQVLDAVLVGCREGVTISQSSTPGPTATALASVEDALATWGFDVNAATISATTEGSSPEEVLVVEASLPFDPPIGWVPTPDTLQAQMSMYLEIQD